MDDIYVLQSIILSSVPSGLPRIWKSTPDALAHLSFPVIAKYVLKEKVHKSDSRFKALSSLFLSFV